MTSLTDEQLIILGEIAVAAARLEYQLALVVGDFIDPDPTVSQVVTAGLSFERMVELGRRLVSLRAKTPEHKAAAERFVAITGEAMSAMRVRNQVLHGHWVVEEEGGVSHPTLRTRTRKGEVTSRLFVDMTELEEARTRLARAASTVQVWYVGTLEWNGSFRERSDGNGLVRIGYPEE